MPWAARRPGCQAGTLMLIGQTDGGRVLTVILAEEGEDVYYPITARPADRKERAIFYAEAGDTE